MRSLSTPWPASSGPAPGPMIVISPTGLARQTTALAVPSTAASRSSPGSGVGATRADVAGSAGPGELKRPDVPDPGAAGRGFVELGPGDSGDSPAGDVLAPQLPAEDDRRDDHQFRYGVVALDIRGRVALGQARPLGVR